MFVQNHSKIPPKRSFIQSLPPKLLLNQIYTSWHDILWLPIEQSFFNRLYIPLPVPIQSSYKSWNVPALGNHVTCRFLQRWERNLDPMILSIKFIGIIDNGERWWKWAACQLQVLHLLLHRDGWKNGRQGSDSGENLWCSVIFSWILDDKYSLVIWGRHTAVVCLFNFQMR